MSDAQRNVRLYTTIKDRKTPLRRSRPSVPHGTNFVMSIVNTIVAPSEAAGRVVGSSDILRLFVVVISLTELPSSQLVGVVL